MNLSESQIRERLKRQPKADTIRRAVRYEERIRFHAETLVSYKNSVPLLDFFAWVEGLLPSDKVETFKTLFRFPLCTNELTSTCFDKLSRVFDGRNPVNDFRFLNAQHRDDWERYRRDFLHEPEVWQQKGWDWFKTRICSFLVVDLPTANTEGRYAEPYFYWLGIEHVLDYEDDGKGGLEFIMFRQDNDTVAVIDSVSYRKYEYSNGDIGRLLLSNEHGLGYCPARSFWSEPLSLSQTELKAHPLSKVLYALDVYLFRSISKQHLDLYASYPIYSGYEQECDYEDSEGNYCSHGFLKDKHHANLMDSNGVLQRCPKCGRNHIAGAGSFIEVPAPTEGQKDLIEAVKIIGVDKHSLEYGVKEEERLKENIINSVVGIDNEVLTTQAVNEAQIQATFENKSAILGRIKKGFEEAQKFVDDTVCRLRYGISYRGCTINYGTEFYTLTAQEIRKRYRAAKDGGANESDLDAIQRQLIETEFRNNPTGRLRMLILSDVEPYRHISVSEALSLYREGVISQSEMRIKSNFAAYIRRFERENGSILDFGTQTTYAKKIQAISKRLEDYATETEISNNNQNE